MEGELQVTDPNSRGRPLWPEPEGHTHHSGSCAPASVLSCRAGGQGSHQHSATGWGAEAEGAGGGRALVMGSFK